MEMETKWYKTKECPPLLKGIVWAYCPRLGVLLKEAAFVRENSNDFIAWCSVNPPLPPVFKTGYGRGDIFKIGDHHYILASVSESDMALISLQNGNRFTEKVEVFNWENISEEEWMKISKGQFILEKKSEL